MTLADTVPGAVKTAYDLVHAVLDGAGVPVARNRPAAIGSPIAVLYPGDPPHQWVTVGRRLQVNISVAVFVPFQQPFEVVAAWAALVDAVLVDANIRTAPAGAMIINPDASVVSIAVPATVLKEVTL